MTILINGGPPSLLDDGAFYSERGPASTNSSGHPSCSEQTASPGSSIPARSLCLGTNGNHLFDTGKITSEDDARLRGGTKITISGGWDGDYTRTTVRRIVPGVEHAVYERDSRGHSGGDSPTRAAMTPREIRGATPGGGGGGSSMDYSTDGRRNDRGPTVYTPRREIRMLEDSRLGAAYDSSRQSVGSRS
eukprot:CAMPEP_0183746892 /NCGR_PEP_ID=MMETSP0737-20130205/66986_1 /TAXON_ID=385413 /ORGANISM="Thalassiosira miniscula, Strain CCMP1093" /LENGTH=189 /DNA_ID=CAMNT_0025982599 /DNA_START=1285 /DNA_END=1853 /DNA_ORIENTATION=+